jgi:hypothetical protein
MLGASKRESPPKIYYEREIQSFAIGQLQFGRGAICRHGLPIFFERWWKPHVRFGRERGDLSTSVD